ncbi:MAG TPA: NAD(P)/FAD-dependent oxidoreductase [Vicinamibacterales bacterium]|nr:NAD(P)/FAD-dependent oxidoreductase [Vicinamibacterales bacterium]
MQRCDVLIVGGGPAGSSCARVLRQAGARVIVLERARFPRDKVCAGWVTPAAFAHLDLAPADYGSTGLVLQELRGFRTGILDGRQVETPFDRVVSYAIRRCEFDAFLARRSGARIVDGTPVTSIERRARTWVVNGAFAAPMLVGAGGHFCPVARRLRPPVQHGLVVAREIEVRLGRPDRCAISGDTPELFFCRDLEGYGWLVRKGDYLNVGIGRRVPGRFQAHAKEFAAWLASAGRLPLEASDYQRWKGHAYLLAGATTRTPVDEGLLLIGDAAGLAAPESGEGIGPAIESGVLAARTIVDAAGQFGIAALWPYAEALRAARARDAVSRRLRAFVPAAVGRRLLAWEPVTRRVLSRWFLHGAGGIVPQSTAAA